MTREEAIRSLKKVKLHFKFSGTFWDDTRAEACEALDMAIEALSQPIVAKHFDIQSGYIYCSPQIAENVKVVVRCKDCRHHGMRDCPVWGDDTTEDYMWCYYGERREE